MDNTNGLKSVTVQSHFETHQHNPNDPQGVGPLTSIAVNVLIIELDNGRKFRVEGQELYEDLPKGETDG